MDMWFKIPLSPVFDTCLLASCLLPLASLYFKLAEIKLNRMSKIQINI